MTSLQNLQAEARKVIEFKLRQNFNVKGSGKTNDFLWEIDDILAHIYTAALQEALGKVPGGCCKECFHASYDELAGPDYMVSQAMPEGCKDEECPCHIRSTETIQGMESLIPKKDI